MGWWKADPVDDPPKTVTQSPSTNLPLSSTKPFNHPPTAGSEDKCPVDPKTREIWLQAAKAQQQNKTSPTLSSAPPQPASTPTPAPGARPRSTATAPSLPSISTTSASKECSSDRIDQSITAAEAAPVRPTGLRRPLSQEREVSTIPRAQPMSSTAALPSNSETETGHDKTSGNWIYPSETQFFNAVMRKATTTTSPNDLASSISSIIPIHNAVNERAWAQIKQWEGDSSKACGGPKLLSFQGLGAGALSPKAKWNTWVKGAKEPFDRHDWIVERCDGNTVEYVIDFYQGKGQENIRDRGGNINFYLDVRPKLNSIEGCRMRAEKWLGWR